jgi:HAMP domain-containing protein
MRHRMRHRNLAPAAATLAALRAHWQAPSVDPVAAHSRPSRQGACYSCAARLASRGCTAGDPVRRARRINGAERMGLRAKFNLVVLVAFAVGFAVAALVLHGVSIDAAREQVLQNARIMMTAANAIRKYTADDLAPLLPMERDGKFVAETVPAFAAQTNFKAVRAAFAGYTYHEPALNPSNLDDRAQDWEADIIREFRSDPSKKELVVERDTPIGPTLNLARPITITDRACLTCHSTAAAAPAALIKSYGATNGFGWKLNETIGAQILTVPMALPLELARKAYITFLMVLLAMFAVIFAILNLQLHFLVVAPVKRVSAMADSVSLGDEDVETYIKPGRDEISSLSVSFNRMRESLRQALEMIK